MDHRLDYPATGRNRDAILDVLRAHLPDRGLVLEVASGSGQHHVHFARNLPDLVFQPTDIEEPARRSIAAWQEHEGLTNVRAPLALDVLEPWPIQRADVLMCINMIHISPWRCTEALLSGAGRTLEDGGVLFLYGPYRIGGELVPSNARFDQSLRSRDPEWGVRDLERIVELAGAAGLGHVDTVAMPANNHSVVFQKRAQKM
ncbi:MAG: DUF938 domain-containing protein [Proteobacteria bacterium]|nr:DUF938 domain-containing protein [Pseudomonadota bacterium]